ncbi:MAG: Cna protein B-type domain containing protein, partial [Pseudomonadota bacterium]|nr:Cna protein B-type domain containing protein [Pseudomonadota bacterium]
MTKNPYPSRRDLMTAAATLAAVGPARGLTAKDQAVQAPAREASQETVKGVVFETRTGAGQRQADERGLAGVLVSNGREVVRTEPDGSYTLPIEDGMAVFVVKPTGYAVPLDATTRLPRFSFVHQPHGTPAGLDLLYPGLPPTGPLPASVDFGLFKTEEPKRFDVVLFADPQPESHAEIDFIRDDVVNGLIGVEAAFGITAGDIMFDDLSLYGRYNRIIGQIGLPWWNIGGNHDLNFEAPDSRHSRETFKRVFGANYYAFEYGDALFLMLDNVEYHGADPAMPRREGKYRGFFGERQLAFVANALR